MPSEIGEAVATLLYSKSNFLVKFRYKHRLNVKSSLCETAALTEEDWSFLNRVAFHPYPPAQTRRIRAQ